MRIITNLRQLRRAFKRPVVAIGIFDGVHLGHKKILREVVRKARIEAAEAVVVTFDPHPRRFLEAIYPTPLLTSLKHRLNLIGKEGLDAAVVLNFNEAMARSSAADFIKDVLAKKIGARCVFIGSNFRFGRNKEGSPALLKRYAKIYGFSVRGVPLLKVDSGIVSSSRLRALVIRGHLKKAERLLGRPVSILGTVVHGSKRGKILGFPTANIDPHHEAIPPCGVYAVYAIVDSKRYKGVLNIGVRPTFDKGQKRKCKTKKEKEPVIEAHLFDFNKKIYGKDIEVIFVQRLRAERRFSGREKLVKQIGIDERSAHMVL